jgi:bacterial/archaeal transporter family protein
MNWLTWALLSAFFAGVTAVLAKVGVEQVNSHLATALRTTVVLVFTWAIAAFSARAADWQNVGRRELVFLSLSGLATGLSWLCYFRALQLGEVSKVAPIDKLSVAIAIALSFAFLGERLSPRELAGVALIVAGSLVLAFK